MKQFAKFLCNFVALAIVAPFWLAYSALSLCLGAQRVFPGASQLFSLLPGIAGQYLRRAFYQLTLAQCGRDVCLSFHSVMSHPTVQLGDHVYVGVGCMLGDVTLADDVLIGSHVSIINGSRQHGMSQLDIPVRLQAGVYPRITIGADSWIGDRAVVMADVGRHCVVGAGAVVTRPVADFAIVAGNPARVIGWRRSPASPGEADANQPAEHQLPVQVMPLDEASSR